MKEAWEGRDPTKWRCDLARGLNTMGGSLNCYMRILEEFASLLILWFTMAFQAWWRCLSIKPDLNALSGGCILCWSNSKRCRMTTCQLYEEVWKGLLGMDKDDFIMIVFVNLSRATGYSLNWLKMATPRHTMESFVTSISQERIVFGIKRKDLRNQDFM